MRRLLPLLLMIACDPVTGDVAAELTLDGGCGDVVLFAKNADDTLMLTVFADGLVSDAFAAGVETTTTFALPDADIDVIVEHGRKISDAICDDVIENGGPDVSNTWTATGGTATIVVRPGDSVDAGRADLTLDGVTLEDDGGHEITLDALELVDISVGWLAG